MPIQTKLITVLLFSVLSLLPFRTKAQTEALISPTLKNQKNISFGVRGGFNLTNAFGSISNNQAFLRGHGGAFAAYPLSTEYSVQLAVLYSGSGTSLFHSYQEYKLNYLQAPVMLVLNSGYMRRQWDFMAGAYVAHLIRANTFDAVEKIDISQELNRHDAGLSIGIRTYTFSNTILGCQYNHGLLNILRYKEFNGARSFYNQALQIYFGVFLR